MIALPESLAPWAGPLAIFPLEVAVGLGDLIRSLAALVGPASTHATHEGDDPSGFDGLETRGNYERLLLSEWLLADELEEEFTRRAAHGEHLFLRPARESPKTAKTTIAVFDAGPSQIGTPRIVHLALLVVLARRAAAASADFRWGVLQARKNLLRTEVDATGVLMLLGARSTEPPAAHRLDDARHQEVWTIGGALATRDVGGTRITVSDTLEESARVRVRVEIPGRSPREAVLDLPAEKLIARLLRDPFAAAAAETRGFALPDLPLSNLVFSANGTKVFTRTGRGLLSIPVPNSPLDKPGAAKSIRSTEVIAAVGRMQRSTVHLAVERGTRILALRGHPTARGLGHYTSTENVRTPFEPTDSDPLQPLLVRERRVAFLDARKWLFELDADAAPALVAREVLAVAPTAPSGGYAFVARKIEKSWCQQASEGWSLGIGAPGSTSVTALDCETVEAAFLSIRYGAPLVALRLDDTRVIVVGTDRAETTIPAGSLLVGVAARGASFELFTLDRDRHEIGRRSADRYELLLRSSTRIDAVALDPDGSTIAILSGSAVVLHSIARGQGLARFEVGR